MSMTTRTGRLLVVIESLPWRCLPGWLVPDPERLNEDSHDGEEDIRNEVESRVITTLVSHSALDAAYVSRRTAESRAAQGMPRHVQDQATIAHLRTLTNVTEPHQKSQPAPRAA